jgi:superfamily I DNA/RNA helicase
MEWHRVFILDAHLMPSKWATRAWMREQEDNLAYVAITRAKSRLSYITSGGWGKDEVIVDHSAE